MNRPNIRAATIVALATFVVFLCFAGDGLQGYFAPDEMMNLYQAWSPPVTQLIHHDRPLGALVYRGLFAAFGLHPLPYRIFCLLLVAVNLALLFRFCRLVSGSGEVAALAVIMGAYHPHLADLYYTSSNVFDLGCFFFYFLALTGYIDVRQGGARPSWRQMGWIFGCYLGALGFKEMAVTLPAMILAYEAIWHRGAWKNPFNAWVVAAFVPVTLAYIAYKTSGAHAMARNPEYAVHLSLHSFMAAWRHYLPDLFYRLIPFHDWTIAVLWTILIGLAVLSRRRDLAFALCVMTLGALPILFIVPRGFFVLYLTLPGWYLYAGRTMVMLRDLAVRATPDLAKALAVRPEQFGLFAAVAVVWIVMNAREKPAGNGWTADAFAQTRPLLTQLSNFPAIRPGARVLFLSDPCPPNDYLLYFMLALHYRVRDLHVDRAKDTPALLADSARANYDYVFQWSQGTLQRLQ